MKPWIVVGSAIAVGLAIGGGVLAVRTFIHNTPTSTPDAVAPTATPDVGMKEWTDPAGFVLSYPENLTLNKHDEDQENYAHLEFTDPNHPGNIIVWAKDIPAGVTDVDSWVKKEPTFAGANVIDTTLGGEPAKKVMVTTPVKRIVVGAVYDDVLWYVEVTPTDASYWTPIGEKIATSYTYKSGDSTIGAPQESGDAGEAVDEEEVLE